MRSAAASFTRLSRGEWWTCWASRLGVEGEVKNQRPPAANLSSASQSISVAVCVPAVPWGRERSSRIVSLATGYPALSFSGIKRRTDANGIMPTGILDPLRDGGCRGRAENEASNRHRCVPKFHGTPHRGLAVLAYYRTPRGSASTDERPRLHSPLTLKRRTARSSGEGSVK